MAVILGITSLPSVTNVLTWKEFAFVQSKLGWLCLIFGCAHTLFFSWPRLTSYQCHFFLHGAQVRKIMYTYIHSICIFWTHCTMTFKNVSIFTIVCTLDSHVDYFFENTFAFAMCGLSFDQDTWWLDTSNWSSSEGHGLKKKI